MTAKPPKRPGTYPTAHVCRLCREGKLVEVYAFHAHTDPLMRRSAFLKRMSVYCARCGVAYGKLPDEAPYLPAADGTVLEATPAELAAEHHVDVSAGRPKRPQISERDFVDKIEDIFDQLGEGATVAAVSADLMRYVCGNLGHVEGHGLAGLERRAKRDR